MKNAKLVDPIRIYTKYKLQEAMENFVFPDNLQGMPIFCQIA